jgi:hypothetical protein
MRSEKHNGSQLAVRRSIAVDEKRSTEEQERREIAIDGPYGRPDSPAWKVAEGRIVRKLDLTLMPMVWILYMFNYLDRNNIALVQPANQTIPEDPFANTNHRQARLDEFKKDIGLVGNQFNIAVSILNVGYMLAQLPSNMILTRVRPSLYLPCCVLVWSCVSAATAGVQNFPGLIAVRFFLGIVEAPFFPGVCFRGFPNC